jgi:hypothetical protein
MFLWLVQFANVIYITMPKAWEPGMPPPPWSGDNNAMRDFVFFKLENFYRTRTEELRREPIDPDEGSDFTISELLDSSDPSEHEQGLALLRQLNVRWLGPDANRIQWQGKPGRPKGQPRHTLPPKPPIGNKVPANRWYFSYSELVDMAKKAVSIIRDIWREHYDGKWQRSRGDIDAHDIAAAYFVVDVEDVKRKRSGRHKPKNKNLARKTPRI